MSGVYTANSCFVVYGIHKEKLTCCRAALRSVVSSAELKLKRTLLARKLTPDPPILSLVTTSKACKLFLLLLLLIIFYCEFWLYETLIR